MQLPDERLDRLERLFLLLNKYGPDIAAQPELHDEWTRLLASLVHDYEVRHGTVPGFGHVLAADCWCGPTVEAVPPHDPPQDVPSNEMDLAYVAWTVIANARDWHLDDRQAAEWRKAAERWRDQWYLASSVPDVVD